MDMTLRKILNHLVGVIDGCDAIDALNIPDDLLNAPFAYQLFNGAGGRIQSFHLQRDANGASLIILDDQLIERTENA